MMGRLQVICTTDQIKEAKRNVQKYMRKHKSDEDFIDNISDDFVMGFMISQRMVWDDYDNGTQREKTKEMTLDGSEATGYDVQQAWDKQANFLAAQARAQKTLEGMINRYEDLLHKNWDFATEEQRARIEQIKANTDRLKSGGNDDGEDGVVIVNDAPTGEDIGHCDTEVSGNIQQQES